MPVIEDEAVCLRQWDWSETSQTVSVFTRSAGLLRCVAKGSKRAGAAFSGGVELLSRAHVRVHTKAARDLSILAEWDLAEVFPALRRTLADHYAGLYMADCVQHFAADHDPHAGLYDVLVAGLRGLEGGQTRDMTLLRFQWRALVEAGFRPELGGSANAEALGGAAVLVFDPQAGALSGAAEAGRKSGAGHDWRVRRSTVDLLLAVDADRAVVPQAAGVQRAARFLAAYVRWVLGSQPRSMALVFPDLGVPDRAPAPRQERGGR
ncbi:MAG: DNA repair protein RecO [Phycisphaerales bacterium]